MTSGRFAPGTAHGRRLMALGPAYAWIGVLLLTVMIGMLPLPPRSRESLVTRSQRSLAAIACLAALALTRMLPTAETLTLPMGLPWIGAHFRLERAFGRIFWSSSASLGRSPASTGSATAGMRRSASNPTVLSSLHRGHVPGAARDDVFTSFFAWELMSLASGRWWSRITARP